MIHVFDAGPLIALIKNEPGADMVRQVLLDNPGACFVHSVNICEVFYPILRVEGADIARQVVNDLLATGLEIRQDMDSEFWQNAAGYKAAYPMSLADAFCVALSQRLGAALVTTDRHELEPLLNDGVVNVLFIR